MSSASALKTGSLWINHGKSEKTIQQCLAEHSQDIEAPLFYLEPTLQLNTDGSTGRLKGFQTLSHQLPEHNYPLETAYVFGGIAKEQAIGLQLIATESGCRWFKFSVNERKKATQQLISHRSYSVLTRRDFARFFGQGYEKTFDAKLKVTEYWHETGLLTWWIAKENN